MNDNNQPLNNNQIIDELCDYLQTIKGYSENTIRSYQNDVIQFFRFLDRKSTRLNSSH